MNAHAVVDKFVWQTESLKIISAGIVNIKINLRLSLKLKESHTGDRFESQSSVKDSKSDAVAFEYKLPSFTPFFESIN